MQVNFANASSGTMAASIGWFDFTGVTLPINTSLNLANSLPNGGNISFRLSSQNVSGSLTFTGVVAPQRAGIPFGSTAYTGIAGKPLLYATPLSGGAAKLTIDNIQATNSEGNTIPFGLVVAEGEGSVANEFWTWSTDGTPWTLISNIYGSISNITGVGTQTVTWGGANPWPSPVLASNTPSAIYGDDIEYSQSAIALGVILTPIRIDKNIVNRKYVNDQFKLDILGPQISTTITYGNTLGLQNVYSSVFAGDGETYVLTESMGSGSAGILKEYKQTISIVNLAIGGTTIPSNWKIGDPLTVKMGDNIKLIITNDTYPDVKMTKTVDKTVATLNEILTYTIALANLTTNTVVNLTVIDTIATGTTLVPNSIYVNGILNSGNINPPGLINLKIDASGITTVTYKVTVDDSITRDTIPNYTSSNYSYLIEGTTIPTQNSISNIVTTTIVYASIVSIKSVDKNYAGLDEILTYTIAFTNIGNTTGTGVVFKDTIPNGSSIIGDSVFLNGSNIPWQNLSTGVNLGNLSVGEKSTLTFKVTVVSVPSNNMIKNYGTSNYTYPVNSINYQGNSVTNIVSTTINNVDFSGTTKFVDKIFAKPNDILTYIINIPNSGNIIAKNIVFKDTIPKGTSIILGSLYVNGVSSTENIESGISIPDIGPNEVCSVEFKVRINE